MPAQAHQWDLFGPQTGVDTPIGAPKLEFLAQRAWERAQKLGIDPNTLLNRIMEGKDHLVRGGVVGRPPSIGSSLNITAVSRSSA